ncbi:MAG: glycosyltransferase [Bacteroidales bacterium]|nr:glycosyltransferase [Bacteroidales bacterium]
MISIVMTYYNRQYQLSKTLESLKQYNPKDFNVIIVDDGSTEDIVLQILPYEVTILKVENKIYPDPGYAYNIGFNQALKNKPEIIIIQNAECYHVGDILEYAKRVNEKTYISFGCFSINEELTFKEFNINELLIKNEHGVYDRNFGTLGYDGQTAWYNHPIFRRAELHFCAAITTENLIKLNGFDERYCFGIAYEDNYFVQQIKNLGLTIEITETPFVVHQWHYYRHLIRPDIDNLLAINRKLHLTIMPNGIRSVHLLTPNLDGNS